jgi:hypothetical protein
MCWSPSGSRVAQMTGPDSFEQGRSAKSRRHMATWLIGGFGAILLVAGVVVSFITGTPFSWAAFFLIGGVVLVLFAAFVWIRLAQ